MGYVKRNLLKKAPSIVNITKIYKKRFTISAQYVIMNNIQCKFQMHRRLFSSTFEKNARAFSIGVILIQILRMDVGDVLELKKPHPCGTRLFKVLRIGSDIRIVCLGCEHDMTIDRIKLEKAVKQIIKP